jgi:hypothetical protein
MSGIKGSPSKVLCVGDLPVVATDSHGRKRRVLIKNVRCVPDFTETLISVDMLWEDCKAEARFANHRAILAQLPDSKGTVSEGVPPSRKRKASKCSYDKNLDKRQQTGHTDGTQETYI